jgi:hypothetical protein
LIGAETVQKHLSTPVIVFIFNIPETEATTKHLISLCRQRNTPHIILPKFQQQSLAQLFGVRRLTCFALHSESKDLPWWCDMANPNDSELIVKLNEFDNCKSN